MHKKIYYIYLTDTEGSYILHAISCEAEITSEYDLSESGSKVEAPQETIVQMDRRARRGKQ